MNFCHRHRLSFFHNFLVVVQPAIRGLDEFLHTVSRLMRFPSGRYRHRQGFPVHLDFKPLQPHQHSRQLLHLAIHQQHHESQRAATSDPLVELLEWRQTAAGSEARRRSVHCQFCLLTFAAACLVRPECLHDIDAGSASRRHHRGDNRGGK